ncbi:MAG: ribonuclease HI family protein [Promethearchaeota archaeon]
MINTTINKKKVIKIFTDGAARGNPGPAAISYIVIQGDKVIHQGEKYIGKATNNTAEYKAIIEALSSFENCSECYVQVYSDSKLVIEQIKGNWKINYPHLLKLKQEITKLQENFKKVEFYHVNRENPWIQQCDKTCNQILNEHEHSFH